MTIFMSDRDNEKMRDMVDSLIKSHGFSNINLRPEGLHWSWGSVVDNAVPLLHFGSISNKKHSFVYLDQNCLQKAR